MSSDNGRITRDDIEAKLREVAGPVEAGVEKAKSIGVVVAVAVGAAFVVAAYMMGRRRGKKRSSVIEIRRL